MAVLRRRLALALAGTLLMTVLHTDMLHTAAAAPQATMTITQAKAGFLYNCALFVSWPPATLRGEALTIGVIGHDTLVGVMADAQGRNVNGRTLVIEQATPATDLRRFQIVFVGGRDAAVSRTVLRTIGDAPILTVGEHTRFTQDGGVIRLFTEQDRLRFEVNMTRVELTGLRVSAGMLGLARIVR